MSKTAFIRDGHLRRLDAHRLALYLVLVIPFLVAVIMQAMHLGLATNIGSDIHTTDSAGWVSCQSAFAQFHLDRGVTWCSRRPLAFMLPIPVYWLSPFSLAGVVLLQVAMLSVATWALFRRLLSLYRVPSAAVFLSATALIWLIIQYGTSAGPEALALLLSLLATSSYLRFLGSGGTGWAAVATTLTTAAFLVRPGNPVLLVAICALAVVLVHQRNGQWRWSLLPLVPVVVLIGVLNRVLRALGLSEAGHGSNFWATVHSAADPNIVGWTEVYDKYSDVASEIGTENLAFASFLRDETLSLLASNPLPFVLQVVKNLAYFVLRGFINLFSGFPLRRRSQLSTLEEIARGQTSIFQWSTLWLGVLVVTALALSLISAWMLYRYATLLAREVRSRSDGVTVFHALGKLVLKTDLHIQGIIIGAASVYGAFLFFGVVGHDEDSRHLVMSVPWAVVGVFATLSHGESVSKMSGGFRGRKSVLVVPAVLVLTATLLGFADSRHGATIIDVAPQCADPSKASESWRIVASAPMGSSTRLGIGSDWRRLSTSKTRHFDTPLFMANGILAISGGHLVSLKSLANGEVRTVFLPETQIPSVRSASPFFEIVDDDGLASLRSCG